MTDVDDFLSCLDAGILKDKLGLALSKAAASSMDTDGKGEVTLKLKFERLPGTFQCRVAH